MPRLTNNLNLWGRRSYDDERQSLFSVTLSHSEGSRLSLSHGMPRDRYFVYIMTNVSRTFYTGVTNNLVRLRMTPAA